MSAVVLIDVLPLVGALVAGALAGALAAWRILIRPKEPTTPESVEPVTDPFVEAEIEIAAARWGAERHQPEAVVGLFSDHLKQLYRLGLRKGWF